MAKIIGDTTAPPSPRPDWNQTDETKADYIKNKPKIADSPAQLSIPMRTDTGAVRTATPTEDDHAVNLKYLTDNYGTHEERIADIEAWIDSKRVYQTLACDENGLITIPGGAREYAQITEIHGVSTEYGVYEYYTDYQRNYPSRIVTDTGTVLFEMPSDALSRLTEFGIAGNYIYFEDGKAYYKQTAKAVNTQDGYTLADGEAWGVSLNNEGKTTVILASPIVTDISDYITFDGIVNIEGVTSITVEPKTTKAQIEAWVAENGSYANTTWAMPPVKIVVEV